jgi:hypothetical protein
MEYISSAEAKQDGVELLCMSMEGGFTKQDENLGEIP